MLPRIEIDFDDYSAVRPGFGYILDVEANPSMREWLQPGLRVILFAREDAEVEADVRFDKDSNIWFALPDSFIFHYYQLDLNPHNPERYNELPRIAVDFNTMQPDPLSRVTIPTHVHPELLDILEVNQRVILYEAHDIEVEAVITFDDDGWWYGVPDWKTRRELD